MAAIKLIDKHYINIPPPAIPIAGGINPYALFSLKQRNHFSVYNRYLTAHHILKHKYHYQIKIYRITKSVALA